MSVDWTAGSPHSGRNDGTHWLYEAHATGAAQLPAWVLTPAETPAICPPVEAAPTALTATRAPAPRPSRWSGPALDSTAAALITGPDPAGDHHHRARQRPGERPALLTGGTCRLYKAHATGAAWVLTPDETLAIRAPRKPRPPPPGHGTERAMTAMLTVSIWRNVTRDPEGRHMGFGGFPAATMLRCPTASGVGQPIGLAAAPKPRNSLIWETTQIGGYLRAARGAPITICDRRQTGVRERIDSTESPRQRRRSSTGLPGWRLCGLSQPY